MFVKSVDSFFSFGARQSTLALGNMNKMHAFCFPFFANFIANCKKRTPKFICFIFQANWFTLFTFMAKFHERIERKISGYKIKLEGVTFVPKVSA